MANTHTVTVHSIAGHQYAMLVSDGGHSLVTDEPLEDGGDDLGPSAYELLLSALGSCMSTTMVMYARRKEWALREVSVTVSHERIPASQCSDCTPEEVAAAGPGGTINLIRTDVAVGGDLTPEQTARLLEIGNRCPVHRTLETPPKIIGSIRLA
jgi:putative redox protein